MTDHIWLDAEGNIDWDACAYEAQEYDRRWDELNHFVQIDAAAELHTMDILMGQAAPPVARFAMHPQAFNPTDERCPDCDYTPGGIFAHPCASHACAECGHTLHVDDGCGHPDPRSGWCECEAGNVSDEDAYEPPEQIGAWTR